MTETAKFLYMLFVSLVWCLGPSTRINEKTLKNTSICLTAFKEAAVTDVQHPVQKKQIKAASLADRNFAKSHPSLCCTSPTTRRCMGFYWILYFQENKVPQCLHTAWQDNQQGLTRFARWGEAECTSRALRGRRPRLEEASTAGTATRLQTKEERGQKVERCVRVT